METINTNPDPSQRDYPRGGGIIISLVARVERSRFISTMQIDPDFKTFVESMIDPATFTTSNRKEDLPLLIPAEFPTDRSPRLERNVLAVYMLVLDIDHGTVNDQQQALDIIRRYGHLVHTSYSHAPTGQHKRRAFVKLSRPVRGTEWRAFWPRAVAHLHASKVADSQCRDAGHMYYVPGGDYSKYEVYGGDGPGLDVDFVLAQPLPEGESDSQGNGLQAVLAPEERGEISQSLCEYWDAKLQHLVAEIERRPHPGPIYDLKNGKVFGVAQGAPHIIDPERIRFMVRAAINERYRRSGAVEQEVEALRQKSFEQVDRAISDGMYAPWWPSRDYDITIHPHTDVGLGERLHDLHRDKLQFVTAWNQWLAFTGTHWEQQSGAPLAQELMIDTVRQIPCEADALHAERAALTDSLLQTADGTMRDQMLTRLEQVSEQINAVYKFARASESRTRIAAGLAMASSSPRVRISHSRLDHDPWSFNVLNGTIDLRTGKLRPHDRSDFITRVAPVEYHPEASSYRFEKFLCEIFMEDQALIDYVLRILGYALTGLTTEHCMVIAYGSGCNGKSTLLDAVHQVMGPYAMVTPPDMLLIERRDSHPTGRAALFGVRFASTREIEEGRNLAEAEVKELTGGDPVTARRLYENYWTFNPTHKLWMSTNHLPSVRGTDEGIWRRLRAVPFSASFLGREDRNLAEHLRNGASGILNTLVKGCLAWQREGLTMPPVVANATAEYRKTQDPVGPFVRDCFELDPAVGELGPGSLQRSAMSEWRVQKSRIWPTYRDWAMRVGANAFHSSRRLHERLREVLHEAHSGQDYYYGIRVPGDAGGSSRFRNLG